MGKHYRSTSHAKEVGSKVYRPSARVGRKEAKQGGEGGRGCTNREGESFPLPRKWGSRRERGGRYPGDVTTIP